MNIPQNIKEIIGPLSIEEVIVLLAGLLLFFIWLFRTSFGKKALDDSVPRRNSMPLFMPFALILTIFLGIGLLDYLSSIIFKDLQKWEQDFVRELTNVIAGLISIGIILSVVKVFFVRGIKGFGLNIRTIPRDFATAIVNLFAIWPIMNIVFITTLILNELIYGPNYTIPTHVELQTIAQNQHLIVRITITIGVVVVTPFLEEMLFRGLFQTAIRSILDTKYSAWIAIFITSIFFVINHANASHWPLLFILSMCMGYSYEKSGSLFRAIFIHAIFNGSAVLSTWLQ